jgi:hypothetical protein
MPATRRPARASAIRAWEDDPQSDGAAPVERPVPKLPSTPMKLVPDVAGPPAAAYEPGTAEFRWWAAAEALTRGVAFWRPLLPPRTTWQAGNTLTVRLDAGDKLNAFYNRQTLSFFHATVGSTVLYTGESPDVLTHELGHAILDAVRPQLWDAMSHEVAAFHESFGDISALLSALQLASVRDRALVETGGLYRSSRLSRVAESLGWGVRQRRPCGADPDCLRNAVNCFFYQPPDQIPVGGPAAILSSEPHSYSRVFTGAFYEMLVGMIVTLSRTPTSDDMLQASTDAARLLIAAVQASPVVPNYMSQVAAHALEADSRLFGGKYADAVSNGFVAHGILAPSSLTAAPSALAAASAGPRAPELPMVTLSGRELGLGDRPVVCRAAGESRRLAVAPTALDGGPSASRSPEETARGFLRELIVRDRVLLPGRPAGDEALHTHEIAEDGGTLVVTRSLFDCGLGG